MDRHRFTLTFNLVTCQRCGVERIRGVQCPDCDRRPEPWEIDQVRNRRHALVTSLVHVLTGPVGGDSSESVPHGPLDQPQRVATWLERFWEGLHVATDSEFRDVTALTDAIEELVSLRFSLHAAEPTRPFGRAVRLAQSMADSAVAMVQRYMGALMAATPLGAQASAEEAQRALDELAQLAGELAGWLERQAKVSEAATVQESLGAGNRLTECCRSRVPPPDGTSQPGASIEPPRDPAGTRRRDRLRHQLISPTSSSPTRRFRPSWRSRSMS